MDYRGLLQLDGTRIVKETENVGAPSAKVVTGAEVTESNESQLVAAEKIQYYQWTAEVHGQTTR